MLIFRSFLRLEWTRVCKSRAWNTMIGPHCQACYLQRSLGRALRRISSSTFVQGGT
ncbi:hypothetical protein MPTK1_6g19450 [Marchantia polymorpha subsp. ruderalis]|uniref:Uncharacterized protein n=2 Tax=Marchantia polymorpha TaxID=3197 RepID=A0AAF6BTT7_MARPO|nr:hypothetical protein MARPO_0045s0118 [Marchantia polymorpha]BBN15421.1 hypothetical protein Mp_6g19450 [Marchantia polymorpha subsp. ruderalis]|eukprot:PTQ39467.1 hypothetical protein MARPO_0045s0118 [Marchantia polymorpha]